MRILQPRKKLILVDLHAVLVLESMKGFLLTQSADVAVYFMNIPVTVMGFMLERTMREPWPVNTGAGL